MINHFKFYPADVTPKPTAADLELLRLRVFDCLKMPELKLLLAREVLTKNAARYHSEANRLDSLLQRARFGLLPFHPAMRKAIADQKDSWTKMEAVINSLLVSTYELLLNPDMAGKVAKVVSKDLDRERIWLWYYKVSGGKGHTRRQLYEISGTDVDWKTWKNMLADFDIEVVDSVENSTTCEKLKSWK